MTYYWVDALVKILSNISLSFSTFFSFIVCCLYLIGLEPNELLITRPGKVPSSRLFNLFFSLQYSDLFSDLDLCLSNNSMIGEFHWLLTVLWVFYFLKTSNVIFYFFLFVSYIWEPFELLTYKISWFDITFFGLGISNFANIIWIW